MAFAPDQNDKREPTVSKKIEHLSHTNDRVTTIHSQGNMSEFNSPRRKSWESNGLKFSDSNARRLSKAIQKRKLLIPSP